MVCNGKVWDFGGIQAYPDVESSDVRKKIIGFLIRFLFTCNLNRDYWKSSHQIGRVPCQLEKNCSSLAMLWRPESNPSHLFRPIAYTISFCAFRHRGRLFSSNVIPLLVMAIFRSRLSLPIAVETIPIRASKETLRLSVVRSMPKVLASFVKRLPS